VTCVPSRTPSHFENKELEFKVIKLDRKRTTSWFFSRRAVMDEPPAWNASKLSRR